MATTSTPNYEQFDPRHIPYQVDVINAIKHGFDYTEGVQEVLLSGSVGSAKSILMAHLAVRHCLQYPRARVILCRKALPDLRDTIFKKILEHLQGAFTEGIHYNKNETTCQIRFANGSEVVSRSWSDRKYTKFRSIECSMAVFEELTENDAEDFQAYKECKMRVGRLPHVPEQLIICATNPDSPAHWAYEYFIKDNHKHPRRHIFYSITTDNPFLPETYINDLLEDLDPKEAQRMIYGRWVEIKREVIYHQYGDHNYKAGEYEIDPYRPIHLTFDFNIGLGKPMSATAFQVDEKKGEFDFFDEFIVHGADTEELLGEAAERGFFDKPETLYIINGDATGRARNTASKKSDYEVIKEFLDKYRTENGDKIDYRLDVPSSNPPVRTRHNWVNAYCKNALGKVRLRVWEKCKTLDKGMRLTSLKKGATYQEDDSADYQHVTTALGYGVCFMHKQRKQFKNQQSRPIR